MYDPRARGVSKRFSEAVKNNDNLDATDAINTLMFSPEVRKRKIKRILIWGIVNLVLAIYIGYLIGTFWEHWDHPCIG